MRSGEWEAGGKAVGPQSCFSPRARARMCLSGPGAAGLQPSYITVSPDRCL